MFVYSDNSSTSTTVDDNDIHIKIHHVCVAGECVTPVYDNVPQSDLFIQSIYANYGLEEQCSFDVEGNNQSIKIHSPIIYFVLQTDDRLNAN